MDVEIRDWLIVDQTGLVIDCVRWDGAAFDPGAPEELNEAGEVVVPRRLASGWQPPEGMAAWPRDDHPVAAIGWRYLDEEWIAPEPPAD